MAIQPAKHFLPPVTKSNGGFTGTVPNPASVTVENGLVTHVAQGSPVTSSPSPTDSGGFQVLVDASDTTPGFLGAKITANAPISVSVANPGADETVEIGAANATAGAVGVVQLAGDLGGTATVPKVTGLQGFPVSATAPTTGQVPEWSGTEYVPTTPAAGSGSGLFSYAITQPPALAAFTWINQETATAQNNNAGAIMMSIADAPGGGYHILYKATPATPYAVTALLKSTQFQINGQTSGIYLYDSGSGKFLTLEFFTFGAGSTIRVQRLTNVTTDASNQFTSPSPTLSFGELWLRLRNDGATLYADLSQDGVNWRNLYSEAVGAFLTPDNAGFGGISVTGNASTFVDVSLLSWSIM